MESEFTDNDKRGVSIVLNSDFEDDYYEFQNDFNNPDKRILVCGINIFEQFVDGNIPAVLLDELTKNINGDSPV